MAKCEAMRSLYLLGAALSFALAVAGLVLPVLPCTPFLLVTSFCLVRSAPGLDAKLRRSPLFGPILRDFERHGGVRLSVKITALATLAIAVIGSLVFGSLSTPLRVLLLVLAAIGVFVILRLKTVPPDAE